MSTETQSVVSGNTGGLTALTPVQLSTTYTRRYRRVYVQADSGNSGLISLGNSATTSIPTAGSQQGRVLAASAAESFTNVRLSDIYVNATHTGDNVTWLVEAD